METSPLIRRANQWTDFYIIETAVMKELIVVSLEFLMNSAMALCSMKSEFIY